MLTTHSDALKTFKRKFIVFSVFLLQFFVVLKLSAEINNDLVDLSESFELNHGKKTTHSILFFHGLTETPFFTRDLSQELYSLGYNVLSIRLSGHGLDVETLSRATYLDWLEDKENGLKRALEIGDKVILAGFSLGGALAFEEIVHLTPKISGLLLFAPSLKISPLINPSWICPVLEYLPFDIALPAPRSIGNSNQDEVVRSSAIPIVSGCEILKLIRHINKNLVQVRLHPRVKSRKFLSYAQERLQGVSIPVFLALTEADQSIHVDYVKKLISFLPKHQILAFSEEHNIYHTALIQKSCNGRPCHKQLAVMEHNPYWDELVQEVSEFLLSNFSL